MVKPITRGRLFDQTAKKLADQFGLLSKNSPSRQNEEPPSLQLLYNKLDQDPLGRDESTSDNLNDAMIFWFNCSSCSNHNFAFKAISCVVVADYLYRVSIYPILDIERKAKWKRQTSLVSPISSAVLPDPPYLQYILQEQETLKDLYNYLRVHIMGRKGLIMDPWSTFYDKLYRGKMIIRRLSTLLYKKTCEQDRHKFSTQLKYLLTLVPISFPLLKLNDCTEQRLAELICNDNFHTFLLGELLPAPVHEYKIVQKGGKTNTKRKRQRPPKPSKSRKLVPPKVKNAHLAEQIGINHPQSHSPIDKPGANKVLDIPYQMVC